MLTPRENALFKFLNRYSKSYGFFPTFDEMREELGLSSKSGVHNLLVSLERKGYIERIPNHSRAIKLLRKEIMAENIEITGGKAVNRVTGDERPFVSVKLDDVEHYFTPEDLKTFMEGLLEALKSIKKK